MTMTLEAALDELGVPRSLSAVAIGDAWGPGRGQLLAGRSPIDGALLGELTLASAADVPAVVDAAARAFAEWREWPAPQRGELVRRFGEALRSHAEALATLVTLEAGKITQEARGEVREMIDVADFAVGLSRQLYGLTIASERRHHRLAEQWHPLGPVGVITAFNFPVAVWAWNAMLALVCGDSVVFKPSPRTPLSAMACHALASRVAAEIGAPEGLLGLLVGGADVAEALAANKSVSLVSATGSVAMGRQIGPIVAARLGRSLLELGGNNASIVAPTADLELAMRAIVFAAVGTCGQRCTSLRRLIVHESVADAVLERLRGIYARLPIGDPRTAGVLVGPLVDSFAFEKMQRVLGELRGRGAVVHGGERVVEGVPAGGYYVRPAIVEASAADPLLKEETFAPILYILRYRDFDSAITLLNDVPQGLSASIFTNDMREAERFCSASGAYCGLVNVNSGTSGAEIGGAFGGEKDTGGGRESGSDAWKAYMRRATNTVNYSSELPLAQGIEFSFD